MFNNTYRCDGQVSTYFVNIVYVYVTGASTCVWSMILQPFRITLNWSYINTCFDVCFFLSRATNIQSLQRPILCGSFQGYRLNDGFWHTVDLAARDNLLSVTIDEDESSPLKITNPFVVRTGNTYFFGGK